MAIVPDGKKIVIGNKTYKAGQELPKDYKLKTPVRLDVKTPIKTGDVK